MSRTTFSRRKSASRPKSIDPSRARTRELNTKRRGELAELAFTLKAASLGFGVSKPYGDSERYDVIVDPRALQREQRSNTCHPEIGKRTSKARTRSRSKDLTSNSITDAAKKNSNVAWLVSDVSRSEGNYDLTAATLWRVQIKASTHLCSGLYRVNVQRRTNGRNISYQPGEFDFLAASIIPEDIWYILPFHAIVRTCLLFRRKDDPKPGLYDQYREAWHLLRDR